MTARGISPDPQDDDVNVEVEDVDAVVLHSHYDLHRQADSYEDAYFYEPGPYADALRDKVQRALGLTTATTMTTRGLDTTTTSTTPPRVLLDVGGGTGNFTRMLLNVNHGNVQAVVVDPFLVDDNASSEKEVAASTVPRIRFVKAGAEQFMRNGSAVPGSHSSSTTRTDRLWWQHGYHQVLMKEMIHHVKDEERVPILRGLREGLEPLNIDPSSQSPNDSPPVPPPQLLIVTRPQIDIDYPLWEAARQVWASQQPGLPDIIRDLELAGFTNVSSTIHSYPCSVSLPRWKDMVRNRFWSTFSHFTDSELEEGLGQMESSEQERGRVDEDNVLTFEDRLLFVSAHNADD